MSSALQALAAVIKEIRREAAVLKAAAAGGPKQGG
jgi:hypothetical protein